MKTISNIFFISISLFFFCFFFTVTQNSSHHLAIELNQTTKFTKELSLHDTCKNGDLERVKYLVEKQNLDIYQEDDYGNIPLHVACNCGNLNIVKYFIEEKKINPQNYREILHHACNKRKGNLEVVQYLIEEQNIYPDSEPLKSELFGYRYNTPLFYAFKKGNVALVEYLLSKGAKLTPHNNKNPFDDQEILQMTRNNNLKEKIIKYCKNGNREKLKKLFENREECLKDFIENYNKKVEEYNKLEYGLFSIDTLEKICPTEIGLKEVDEKKIAKNHGSVDNYFYTIPSLLMSSTHKTKISNNNQFSSKRY